MTQVKCIYCQTAYDIDDSLITFKVKKFRCAKCKQIFGFKKSKEDENEIIVSAPEDKSSKEKKDNTNIDETSQEPNEQTQEDATKNEKDAASKEIFDRLDDSLKKYNIENKEEKKQACLFARTIGWTTFINKALYLIFFVILTALLLNYYRYEITRAIPQAQMLYSRLGLKAAVNGEGLEFANISKHSITKDGVNYMEVKGYIVNTTNKDIKIPEISVNLLDKQGNFLYKGKATPPKAYALAKERASFTAEIRKPSILGRYVYLTFEE